VNQPHSPTDAARFATIEELAVAIKAAPWYGMPDSAVDESVFSMLPIHERKMLTWLAEHMSFDDSGVVDAGCFLGGSTVALCRGLARNHVPDKVGKITVYDMFVAPQDAYSLEAIGQGRTPGASVLDIFERHVSEFRPFLDVRAGDFCEQTAPADPISLCFIDIAKTWEVNDHAVRTFFPRLIPGRTILVQQDYNDHSCPWVNLTMARFAQHFEYLNDVRGSRIYLMRSPIPPERLAIPLREECPPEKLVSLMNHEIETCGNETSRFFNACGKAWLIFECEGMEVAIAYLEEISSQQPWESPEPYTGLVIRAMRTLQSVAGLRRYERAYFDPR